MVAPVTGLISVTVTPAMPGSPASWMPLRFKSFHTKLPIRPVQNVKPKSLVWSLLLLVGRLTGVGFGLLSVVGVPLPVGDGAEFAGGSTSTT